MNTVSHAPPNLFGGGPLLAGLAFVLSAALAPEAALAAAKLKIAKAGWSDKTGMLVIKGSAKNISGPVDVYDLNGRRLGSSQGGSFALTLSRQDLADVPCAVRVEAGDVETVKLVKGAPKTCTNAPICSIVTPAEGTALQVGTETHFEATASSTDPAAQPLKYEWDFAGGAWGHPTELMAMATFVRDNSSYRVRFAATDAKGRRCEDAVEVTVGMPPSGLPAKVAEQPAPRLGSELEGTAGDLVVLPFEDWTMQHTSDMRMNPNGYASFNWQISDLNAYVYQKARLPVAVNSDQVEVRYSAASNPSDPVGTGSINSTSQNWPLSPDISKPSPMMSATLQKTDIWETKTRDSTDGLWKYYQSLSWAQVFQYIFVDELAGLPKPDEGYFLHAKKPERSDYDFDEILAYLPADQIEAVEQDNYDSYAKAYDTWQSDPGSSIGHGAYLPGVDNPYQANNPQSFTKFDAKNNWFATQKLPLTDIDDSGRVNPYPLLRVEAIQKGTQNALAKTDSVLSNSRDFHCSECHAKGKLAAQDNRHTKAAFHASPMGMMDPSDNPPDNPQFFSVEDIGGDPNSLFDLEYAAALNYSSIHQFYDGMGFLDVMLNGSAVKETQLTYIDSPHDCLGCHPSPLYTVTVGSDWGFAEERDYSSMSYDPNYSIAMHRFHAEMQYNADKSDIVRDDKGMYKRFDWKSVTSRTPNQDINPNTLFPIFKDGNQLPMEENCLKCHGGHREQLYRDRMYTAGVTCYDCHGDMLAVGQAFAKDPTKLGSNNRADYRVPWFNETDCGSCHVGTGNISQDGASGYFSAGVRRTAFDETDLSAKTRPVDKNDPNAVRFAVVPNYQKAFKTTQYRGDTVDETPTTIDAPLFREGRDTHGNVACAACHGAAHAVWPNRDPSANDNVTALQLQGHTGTILECNVCHTADSFAKLEDLDGGQYSGDPKPGILGGPHNTHPINDPYWWKSTQGDVANTDGTTYGGWHNNYAKMAGIKGEDQCAACHGNDHKGTRLSKTPVDRVFDFRGLDGKKLKKAGFKSKVVKVAAGTPIRCDTCHSLETSFVGSPGH